MILLWGGYDLCCILENLMIIDKNWFNWFNKDSGWFLCFIY